jgi:hypothetical protein
MIAAMRYASLLVVLLLAGACGGGTPTAPSTAPPTAAVSFSPGSYQLMITMSTPSSGGGSCFSIGDGSGSGVTGVIAPTAVQVERSGDAVTVRPDDPSATFRMQLQLSGAALTGTASGQYRSSATNVTVGGASLGSAASAVGAVAPSSASGALYGTVSVEGMTCVNGAHTWTLTPASATSARP